ncbi:phage terminase large subunit [Stenotrophomonas maltophilia]|uniref:phage terminase large subunit n=1 Tax=Stenotrophomonas maltophilia TaxID=40324 RepID=UPI0013DABAB1|nr:phage terminase large subunit [Stenotrophomonas maltophilia]
MATPERIRITPKISFLAFFFLWAERMGWEVPELHIRVCVFLEEAWRSNSPLLLLMLPRGHAKSTILEVFNAWIYYCWRMTRILHQSESDSTALKTSRGTQNVLRNHPLTRDLLPASMGTIEQWWVDGAAAHDARNASMYARGILSNTTSSRADFIQNDDIEVPGNIGTPEAREKLRYRLGEQIHIAVPGAPKLYIGTPHTHDSIYEDVKRQGAKAMVVRMFRDEYRIEKAERGRYQVGFHPEFVFMGIGETARLLVEGIDYKVEGTVLLLDNPAGALIDCYAGAAWPERFDAEEMQLRRQQTRTIGEWDSQYQLHAKPVTRVRLDPDRIVPYELQPVIRKANGTTAMFLGSVQIAGAAVRWDPSSGKLRSDVSAVSVVLQDLYGRRYLHRIEQLTGEVAEFDDSGKRIIGGQVWQLCNLVEELNLTRIVIETNGIGGFAPAVLRAALKQRRLVPCAVVERQSTVNKNKRILESWEPLLLANGQLWGHVDVLRGPLWDQMKDWKPEVQNQPDDLLDAGAGALTDTPERVGKIVGNPHATPREHWGTGAGVFEVPFER